MKTETEIKENGNSTKTIVAFETFPLLRFPKEKNEFFCLYYSSKKNSLTILFSKESNKLEEFEEFELNSFPVEICSLCKSKLNIKAANYIENELHTISYYCSNCCKDKKDFKKFISENEHEYKENVLINNLKEYLKNNENGCSKKYINQMEDVINFTRIVFANYDVMNYIDFKKEKYILSNYIDNLSFYLEQVKNIEMNYIYLFVKNIFVIGISNYDKYWFVNKFISVYEFNSNFNIYHISKILLKRIFQLTFNIEITKKSDCINLYKNFNYNRLCNNFFSKFLFDEEHNNEILFFYLGLEIKEMKSKLTDSSNNLLIEKIKIIKDKINQIISNYYDSFNLISSKKEIERKIINSLLYLIFKYNHNLFEEVKENDKILTNISNELVKIKKYLKNLFNKATLNLEKKIQKEIEYYENNKDSLKKDINKIQKKMEIKKQRKNKSSSIIGKRINKSNINLTEEEKKLLKQFSIEDLGTESFTTILSKKNITNSIIEPKKLQVIIEFLFFLRDKTIEDIHLINSESTKFFSFLNKDIKENSGEDQQQNLINKIKIENNYEENYDDNDLPELHKEINFQSSKEEKKINEELINKIKVKIKEEIKVKSALNYLFQNKLKLNNNNEIEFLYNNIIIPENLKDKVEEKMKELFRDNEYKFRIITPYFLDLKEKILSSLNLIDAEFKEDPLYDFFQEEFANISKQLNDKKNLIVNNKKINFYEKYVTGFKEFKALSSIYLEYKNYENIHQEKMKKYEDLLKIKAKYDYILANVEKLLIYYRENYDQLYNEWKTKNKDKSVNEYELNDLFKDIKRLIPPEESIKIVGKNKSNFIFILYLFQKGYFLKDYI